MTNGSVLRDNIPRGLVDARQDLPEDIRDRAFVRDQAART
jgi:hypothetical protein